MKIRTRMRRLFPAVMAMALLGGGTAVAGGTPAEAVGAPAGRDVVPGQWQAEIRQLVHAQEAAVVNGDVSGYMQTIDPGDPHYRKEQQRWMSDAVTYLRDKTYRRFVRRFLYRADEQEAVALVEQLVDDGRQTFRVQMPIRFRRTSEGWKDADLPFLAIEGTEVRVKATHRRLMPLAEELLRRAEDARRRLSALYGWRPQGPSVVKLYGDGDWFRQSVKLSLPEWVVGWHEAGESIKLWIDDGLALRERAKAFYHSAVIHEMVHQMVADLTNDNAAYWLHEGLAEHLSALLDAVPENDALPSLEPKPRWSWPELAAVRLERLPAELAEQYYRHARLILAFLLDCYGDEALRAVFARLRDDPPLPDGTMEKQSVLHSRTVRALEAVLQKPFHQLADEWWRWVSFGSLKVVLYNKH